MATLSSSGVSKTEVQSVATVGIEPTSVAIADLSSAQSVVNDKNDVDDIQMHSSDTIGVQEDTGFEVVLSKNKKRLLHASPESDDNAHGDTV